MPGRLWSCGHCGRVGFPDPETYLTHIKACLRRAIALAEKNRGSSAFSFDDLAGPVLRRSVVRGSVKGPRYLRVSQVEGCKECCREDVRRHPGGGLVFHYAPCGFPCTGGRLTIDDTVPGTRVHYAEKCETCPQKDGASV